MNFSSLAEKTRSYRRFQEEKQIPSELLMGFVRDAGLAPCASNLQRLRFSIITDKIEREKLFSGIGWAGFIQDWNGPELGERPSAYILIHAPEEEKFFTGIDVGIAASYIVLSASAEGIGSCMLLNYDKNSVNEIISVSGYIPKLVIALGYPGETVILEKNGDDFHYWHDTDGNHHVPKLTPEKLLLKG